MASLRQMAKCINLGKQDFAVARDFFGYKQGPPDKVSLLTQMRRLKDQHIHLNIIRVGNDQLTASDVEEMDQAVYFTRNTFASVNLGVGRVEHYAISTSDADGADNIDSDDEAVQLADDWTVDNDALDVFFVLTYAGSTIGYSAVGGPCDKDNSRDMEGSVVAIEGSPNTTGYVLAHEVGHYLGLSHSGNNNNLMFGTVPNGGNLTSSQGSDMRNHCFVNSGC